jgi:hypothetical protein
VPAAVPGVYRPDVPIKPAVALPPEMPSTLQTTAPTPDTLAVNCCVCERVREAMAGLTVTLPLTMVTVAAVLAPPGPVHVRV